MSRIRGKDTKPEMVVRRLVHGMGYRYRLHARDLPGKPDIVFRSRKKAIFVHGCFWHQHQSTGCPLVAKPKSNAEFWKEKLLSNVKRDKRNLKQLRDMGWDVLVLWECQIKKKPEKAKTMLSKFLG